MLGTGCGELCLTGDMPEARLSCAGGAMTGLEAPWREGGAGEEWRKGAGTSAGRAMPSPWLDDGVLGGGVAW